MTEDHIRRSATATEAAQQHEEQLSATRRGFSNPQPEERDGGPGFTQHYPMSIHRPPGAGEKKRGPVTYFDPGCGGWG